jgi:hypothetical protein
MGRKPKIETIKKRLDSIVKDFELEICKMECEWDIKVRHFHYLDIIYIDNKAYIFPRGKKTLTEEKK